jgi:hypothetical protein
MQEKEQSLCTGGKVDPFYSCLLGIKEIARKVHFMSYLYFCIYGLAGCCVVRTPPSIPTATNKEPQTTRYTLQSHIHVLGRAS